MTHSTQVGAEPFAGLDALLDVLGAEKGMRMRDHLRGAGVDEV